MERLSPSFVRVELGGPALADFGVDGPLYDLRIKLVFPNDAGELPSFVGADESWWDTWLELPESERGHMRTYTVRAVRGAGADTRMVVDLVLHPADGEPGPGSAWAEQASVGDRLVTMAPRRGVRVRRHRVRARDRARAAAGGRRDRGAGGVQHPGGPRPTTPAGSRCSRCRSRRTLPRWPTRSRRRTSTWSGCPGTGRRSARSSRRGAAPPGRRWRVAGGSGGRHGGGPRPVGDPGVLLLR